MADGKSLSESAQWQLFEGNPTLKSFFLLKKLALLWKGGGNDRGGASCSALSVIGKKNKKKHQALPKEATLTTPDPIIKTPTVQPTRVSP